MAVLKSVLYLFQLLLQAILYRLTLCWLNMLQIYLQDKAVSMKPELELAETGLYAEICWQKVGMKLLYAFINKQHLKITYFGFVCPVRTDM